jgi:hypothetical protein
MTGCVNPSFCPGAFMFAEKGTHFCKDNREDSVPFLICSYGFINTFSYGKQWFIAMPGFDKL